MGFFQNLFGSTQTVDLKPLLEQGAFIVDVREPGEFARGTVRGAVNIPLGRLQSQLSQFKGKQNIIVFCRSGNRSGQAKIILEQNGCKQVVNGGSLGNVQQFVN